MQTALLVPGILLLVFGLGCLNYTTAGSVEHHRERAQELGLPEPSRSIFLMGLVCTTVGAGMAGFALGRRRK